MAGSRAAVDRDRGALDVTPAFGAQEQRERGNVFRLAEAAHVVLDQRLRPQFLDCLAQRRRPLLAQLFLPLGVGIAGMNGVHVDVVAVAELRQALGKVGHRGIDRAANQEFGIGGARGAPDDVDHAAVGGLQQRPEQSGEPHAAEEFQRITLEPHGIGQIDECPRARRARIVDQYVATLEAFVDPLEQLLAGRERAQIAGDGEGLRSLRGNRLGGDREIFRR